MSFISSWLKSFKGRIFMVSAFPTLLVSAIGLYSVFGMQKIASNLKNGTSSRVERSQNFNEVVSHVGLASSAFWEAKSAVDPKNRNNELAAMEQGLKELKEHFLALKADSFNDDVQAEIKPVLEGFNKFEENYLKTVALFKEGSPEKDQQAIDLYKSEVAPYAALIKTNSIKVNNSLIELYQQADAAESKDAMALVNLSISLVLLGLCLALVGGYVVATQFSKKIFSNILQIENSTKDFQNITSELHQASDLLSSSSTGSASSLEQTVSSLEELASMVRLNADHAKEAAGLSNASSKAATEGDIETQKLIDSMNEIKSSSKRIEEIINVIDDIAFQTNLLALNASVEAARAGEHGKGFAVVADAVRTLAQRSAVAAKDITTLIKDSVSKIETGTSLADRSGEVLKGIVSSVKKVADLNTEIATASQEQADGITTINKAMNEIDKATQTTAHLSEKVSKTSTDLGSHAANVNNEIDGLRKMLSGGKNFVHAEQAVTPKKSNHQEQRIENKPETQKAFSGIKNLFKSKTLASKTSEKSSTESKQTKTVASKPNQPEKPSAKVIEFKMDTPKPAAKKTKAAEMIPFDEDIPMSNDADPKRKVGTTEGF